MSEKQSKREDTTYSDVIVFVVTVIVLSNGVLSALAGSWAPTIATAGLLTVASWYGCRKSGRYD